MFVTFPVIGGIIANIIGGAMASKVGKKNLSLIGIALCLIGGFFPMFVPTLGLKIAIRVVASLGVGLIQPLTAAIFVLVLFGIPAFVNDIGREEKKDTSVQKSKAKTKLPKAAYVGFLLQLLYCLGYCAIDNCLSLAATETGVISTVSATAIASWGGIASLIGGLFFGMVKNKIGMKVGPVSLILNIIGFIIVGFTSTTALWYVGVTVLKVGFCWWMPYINFLVTEDTDQSNSAMAASLGFAGNSLGSFAFGYVLAGAGTLAGGISSHQAFLYGAVLIALTFVVLVGFNFTNKKNTVKC